MFLLWFYITEDLYYNADITYKVKHIFGFKGLFTLNLNKLIYYITYTQSRTGPDR